MIVDTTPNRCPHYVCSKDVVDGGDGHITFNRLQQDLVEDTIGGPCWFSTTDPWGVTELVP